MSQWTLAVLVAAVGFLTAADSACADSLLDVLGSVLNPSVHSTSAEPQRPVARLAEPSSKHADRSQARGKPPRAGKPPVVAATRHEPAAREPQLITPPAVPANTVPPVAPSALGAVPTGEAADTLRPHSVQTFSVLPPAVLPARVEGAEAARPAADSAESPPATAVNPIEEPAAKPVIAPASDPAAARRMLPSYGIVECALMLLFITCLLVSTKSRSAARLRPLVRPTWGGLPAPPRIDHLAARIGEAAAKPVQSQELQNSRSDRGTPELEHQLARIVQDQIVVTLRKTS